MTPSSRSKRHVFETSASQRQPFQQQHFKRNEHTRLWFITRSRSEV